MTQGVTMNRQKPRFSKMSSIAAGIAFFAILFGCFVTASAQNRFTPPPGRVLMMIGQDCDAIGGLDNYKNGYVEGVVGTDKSIFPAGVANYTSLWNLSGVWEPADYGAGPMFADVFTMDQDFKNTAIVIGLDLVGQLDGILDGRLLQNMKSLAGWMKKNGNRPFFIRPGYEFNRGGNNYDAGKFKSAWKRMHEVFKQEGVTNCAFVWQGCDKADQWLDINLFYPGDQYVDWCGFSYFTQVHGGKGDDTMIEFARQHKKPCMIAEATPRERRMDDPEFTAQQQWDGWHAMVMKKIADNKDVIQAIVYINQDWRKQSLWNNTIFGTTDSRIQINSDLKAIWINEIKKPMWMHASAGLFDTLRNPGNRVVAEFAAVHQRCFLGQKLTFENKSMGKVQSWTWNFGADAQPATATGKGPHTVEYKKAGKKTVSLTVKGPENEHKEEKKEFVLIEDVPTNSVVMWEPFKTENAIKFTSDKYLDSSAWVSSFDQAGYLSVNCADGHDEWEGFHYKVNRAGVEHPANFNHSMVKPVVTVRVKKKPFNPSINHLALLRIDMIDKANIATDSLMPNKFPLTEEFQEFTFDFSGKLVNIYGSSYVGFGPLDERNLMGIKFQVNSGWYSYPDTINGVAYNNFYLGDVIFDWIKLGEGAVEINKPAKITKTSGMNLFVNKSSSMLRVNMAQPLAHATVSIYTLSGQKVQSIAINDKAQSVINCSLKGLSNGVYLCKVKNTQSSLSRKFVIKK